MESPNPSPRRLKFEQLRADYELFLQTFEKPTQIYRYLRSRQALSPMFLQRTLSYMRDRRTKVSKSSKKKRKEFKLDGMLDSRKTQMDEILQKDDTDDDSYSFHIENFLNITFAGFFHGPEFGEEIFNTSDLSKQASLKDEFVDVNLQLIKILARKKKGEEIPVDSLDLGQCTSRWNPTSQAFSSPAASSISIPRRAFKDNGRSVKTYILSIQVTVPINKRGSRRLARKKTGPDEHAEKEVNDSASPIAEPPSKKLKSQALDTNEDTPLSECKRLIYTAELIVFDKHKNCLLTNGEYELLLHNYMVQDGESVQKGKTWEHSFRTKLGPFEMFAFGPTIKFKLAWKDKAITPFQTRSAALIQRLSKQNRAKKAQDPLQQSPKEQPQQQTSNSLRVFYQFIYNNNTRQQTEARDDFFCPWCSLDCVKLYNLLKHLKTCHSRFIFMYTSLSKGARIDVCINDNYGYSFGGKNRVSPTGGGNGFPTKKQPVTEEIIWRPHKDPEDLQEFTEPDCTDMEGIKPFFEGHDRVYYHSEGCIPLKPAEIDYNSEDERTPEWLKAQTGYMIDEFTDVNDGEKELMKMWNDHIMKSCYISDFQLPLACKSFVEVFAAEINEKNLSKNLLLHLVNLCEFNMISQQTILSTMVTYKNLISNAAKSP